MIKKIFPKNFNFILIICILLLLILGIIVLYAATIRTGGLNAPINIRSQIFFIILGIFAFFVITKIDYRFWAKFITPLYILGIILLILVLVVGKTKLGATRWIDFGLFQFQPSELMKPILIVVLAKFLAINYKKITSFKCLLISTSYMIIPVFLVLLQPDLGTAIILFSVWLIMILVAKAKKIHLASLISVGLLSLPLFYKFLKPYQKARLTTFLNPTINPLTNGYSTIQAKIAIGSGQFFGQGLSSGSQSQLNFLPSQYTDFIFAVVAEKLGFLGASLMLIIFGILLFQGVNIALRAEDRFGMFIASGIVGMLLVQLLINVGMNLGIMPITGIPLPFLSYGGTSLIIVLACMGLLESVAIKHKKIKFEI